MDQTQLQAIWEQILQKVQEQESLTEAACKKWLAPVQPLAITGTALELGTPNNFYKEWIEGRYIPFLEDAVLAVTGEKLTLVLKSLNLDAPPAEEIQESEKPVQETLIDEKNDTMAVDTGSNVHVGRETPEQIAPGDASSLNPKYTFETFVTGNSNRFAHAAALAVAESPGKVYNPFFMYGGVGLGKTHLMHAIGHKILQNHPEMRVLYISSEKFTNELINSIRDGNPEAFRQKYRNIDVLLVDDIQ